MMSRLPVKLLSKVQNCFGITALCKFGHIWGSKCWGHSVLQTPALVVLFSSSWRQWLAAACDCGTPWTFHFCAIWFFQVWYLFVYVDIKQLTAFYPLRAVLTK